MYYDKKIFYIAFFKTHIVGPSCQYFMYKIYTTTFVAILLWLYFDHVNSSNRGVAYHPLFFVDKSFWMGFLPAKYKKEAAKKKSKRRPYS